MSIADFKGIREHGNHKMFVQLMEKYINGESNVFEKTMKDILSDVISLSKGEKNFFEVGREYYNVIVYLYNVDKDYYKNVKRKTKSVYKHMFNTMKNNEAIHCFKEY